MKWTIEWMDLDDDTRVAGHPTAQDVCMAVVEFAKNGRGDIKQVGPVTWRLFGPGGAAIVDIDEDKLEIRVRRIISDAYAPRVAQLLDTPEPPPESR